MPCASPRVLDRCVGTVESHKGDWLELAPSGATVAIQGVENWQPIFDGSMLTSAAENSEMTVRFENGEVLVRHGNVDASEAIHEGGIGGDAIWSRALALLMHSRDSWNLAMARGPKKNPLCSGVFCLTEKQLDITTLFSNVPKGDFNLSFTRLDDKGAESSEAMKISISRDSFDEEEIADAEGFSPGVYSVRCKGFSGTAFALIASKQKYSALRARWDVAKSTLASDDEARQTVALAYLCALALSQSN